MIAATTLTSLELRLLGGTDVSAPVMKSSSSALGANAFQDTDVALAPLRDAPHQSNDPTVRRKDAGIRAPDLPWPNHGPHIPPSHQRLQARRALHFRSDVWVRQPVGEERAGRRCIPNPSPRS